MQPLSCLSLRLEAEGLFLLDQTLLPQQECWHPCRDVATLEQMIKTLQVRGAPMIALCCALLLAWLTEQGVPRAQIADALERLRATRPTAVNLMHAMERLRATLATDDWPQRLIGEAERLFIEDRALCTAMAGHGATLIANGDRILTHCNTGGLATAGIGTAIGVIRHAHELGRNISVWVDETRPLLQGGRLTAWELGRPRLSKPRCRGPAISSPVFSARARMANRRNRRRSMPTNPSPPRLPPREATSCPC